MSWQLRMEQWEKRIASAVLWPIGLAVLFLLQQSIFMTTADTHSIDTSGSKGFLYADLPLLHLAVSLALAVLAWLWAKRAQRLPAQQLQHRSRCWGRLGVCAALLAAGAGAWLVLGMRMQPPVGDPQELLRAARQLSEGLLNPLQTRGYLFLYPNQNILVLVEMLVYRLCGDSAYLAMQMLNVVSVLVILYCLGTAAARLLGSDGPACGAVYTGLLALYLPLTLLYTTFMYAVLPGLALAVLGICFLVRYLQDLRWSRGILCGVLCAAAALLKQNYLIFAIAVFLYLLWKALCARSWRPLAIILLTVLLYAGGLAGAKWFLYTRNGLEIAPGKPTSLWVLMGLQDLSAQEGWFNRETISLENIYAYDSYEAADACAKAQIAERLDVFRRDPAYAVRFFARKTSSQWNMATYQGLYVNHNRDMRVDGVFWADALLGLRGRLYPVLIAVFDIALTQMWAGVLFYLLFRKEKGLLPLLFIAIFFGGFLFHLVWEVKAEYALPYVVLLLPCALAGWRSLGLWLAEKQAQGPSSAGKDLRIWICGGAAALLAVSGVSGQYISATAAEARAERAAYLDWYRTQQTSILPDGTYYIRLADNGSFLWADPAQEGAHAVFGDALPITLRSLYNRLLLDDPERLQCYQFSVPGSGQERALGLSSFDGDYFLTCKTKLKPGELNQQLYLSLAENGYRIFCRLQDSSELYLTGHADTNEVTMEPADGGADQIWELVPTA